MDTVLAIVFFAAAFGGMGWLIISQTRKQKMRQAAVDEMAAQKGWTVERRAEGRRRITILTPGSGDWTLRMSPPISTGGSKSRTSIPGYSEFRSNLPNWPGGRAVFSQRMPGGMDRLMAGTGLLGMVQNVAVKAMLKHLVGVEATSDLERLQPFEAPPGIELSILASEDPRDGNLKAIHDVIHGWKSRHARDRSPPAVTIGPEGMTLRMVTYLDEVEDIVAFIDTGQKLAGDLGAA